MDPFFSFRHIDEHDPPFFFQHPLELLKNGDKFLHREDVEKIMINQDIKGVLLERKIPAIPEVETVVLLSRLQNPFFCLLKHPQGDIDSVHPTIRISFQEIDEIQTRPHSYFKDPFSVLDAC